MHCWSRSRTERTPVDTRLRPPAPRRVLGCELWLDARRARRERCDPPLSGCRWLRGSRLCLRRTSASCATHRCAYLHATAHVLPVFATALDPHSICFLMPHVLQILRSLHIAAHTDLASAGAHAIRMHAPCGIRHWDLRGRTKRPRPPVGARPRAAKSSLHQRGAVPPQPWPCAPAAGASQGSAPAKTATLSQRSSGWCTKQSSNAAR